jgi:hypothetical protein
MVSAYCASVNAALQATALAGALCASLPLT